MFLTHILYSRMFCATVAADCWEAAGLRPATDVKPVGADVPLWVSNTFR